MRKREKNVKYLASNEAKKGIKKLSTHLKKETKNNNKNLIYNTYKKKKLSTTNKLKKHIKITHQI